MADHDQCPWCKGWGHDGMDCPYSRRGGCASLYGPERIQCTQRADEAHEWHTGNGVYPDDEPFGTPGEVYGAAWLSHWEPGLTDRVEELS